MARPKNATALYEVIRRTDLSGKDAETGMSDPASEAVTPQPAPSPVSAPVRDAGGQPDRTGRGPVAEGPAPPVFQVVDGRVRLALTPAATAVAIFALACLMVVAYGAGTRVGQRRGHEAGFAEGREYTTSATLDEIQAARTKPPTDGLFEGVGVAPVRRAETPPETISRAAEPGQGAPAGGWVPGYTYVVVQDFRAGDAVVMEQARQYLLDNGVETAVIELEGGYAGRLITTQGFNREDPVQKQLCEDYWARVRKLGQAFFDEGGKYRLEGYLKTLKAETW